MPRLFFSNLQFQKSTARKGVDDFHERDSLPEWMTIHYKTYPRMRRWELQPSKALPQKLAKTLLTRRSSRLLTGKKLSLQEVSDILFWSGGQKQVVTRATSPTGRMYPSAGARYPLEIYCILLRSELPKGLYHYNIKENSLELLWEKDFTAELKQLLVNGKSWGRASAILFVTAVFERTQHKYHERGYRFIFIEAGHLGQNVYLTAQVLGIKTCAVGGFYDETVNKLLDVDGVHEAAIYSLVIGK